MSSGHQAKEGWSSRLGVILAVAGSAVGLGNFLRFPGKAAEYGGGAFMLAYAISFLIIGLPICWAEWTMGRYAGQRGYNSAAGVFHALLGGRLAKYLGILGIIIPVVIFMYYVFIEAWTLGYMCRFVRAFFDPSLAFNTVEDSSKFFDGFVGAGGDGTALKFSFDQALPWLLIVFFLNLWFIFRGISKGIEKVCTIGMPVLMVLAIVILIRVLTLGTPDPAKPEFNVQNGLGYMWNPTKVKVMNGDEVVREYVGPEAMAKATADAAASPGQRVVEITAMQQLWNMQLWLQAAGQIFFSLSVGFGVILVYASYMKPKDDVVLSGLTASSANEFCEVSLGGLITLPAGVAFLGVMGVAGKGTFGLGFNVLPLVFSKMPMGSLFGAFFFLVLFLAAITSSLSMLQPGIAFLEESLQLGRRASVTILGLVTAFGTGFVAYFTGGGLKALDTLDFWVGTFLIFLLATFQIILFGWVFGLEKGWKEMHDGAAIQVPKVFKIIIKYICPMFLVGIFVMWILQNVFGIGVRDKSAYWSDLFQHPNTVAWLSISLVIAIGVALALLISLSPAYKRQPKESNQP